MVFLRFFCFAYAIAFLTNLVPLVACPQSRYDWVETLPVTRGAKDLSWIIVAVVTVAVATETFRLNLGFHFVSFQNFFITG